MSENITAIVTIGVIVVVTQITNALFGAADTNLLVASNAVSGLIGFLGGKYMDRARQNPNPNPTSSPTPPS